jgi:hypothetical protein
MPIKPTSSETEQEFISRCMSQEKESFPDETQRYAVCKSKWDLSFQEMKKQDLYVVVPRKAESRGKYLSRCSANSKVKAQFGSLKERLGFCMTSFNEYYKYWAKIEMSEVPANTALGDCITKQKARGFDYKEAYAHCASRVVAQPGPIVLSEDNLLVEPVAMEGLEDACWEGYEAIGTKIVDGREVPNCVPVDMTEDDFAESINDYPESVKNAAARAVKYADENGWGSCGTDVGKQRASQLAKGENISVDTLKRMYSYLSRHKVDLTTSKEYGDGCGKLMYDAWGGESALAWAEKKLEQLSE